MEGSKNLRFMLGYCEDLPQCCPGCGQQTIAAGPWQIVDVEAQEIVCDACVPSHIAGMLFAAREAAQINSGLCSSPYPDAQPVDPEKEGHHVLLKQYAQSQPARFVRFESFCNPAGMRLFYGPDADGDVIHGPLQTTELMRTTEGIQLLVDDGTDGKTVCRLLSKLASALQACIGNDGLIRWSTNAELAAAHERDRADEIARYEQYHAGEE
jgi:hypothetical protein